jgi:hypothetical protein
LVIALANHKRQYFSISLAAARHSGRHVVLATVNGAKISRQDLSSATESRIKHKEEVINARKREVDLLVSP